MDKPRPVLIILLPLLLGAAAGAGFLIGHRSGPERPSEGGFFFLRDKAAPGAKLEQVLDLVERQYVDTVNGDRLVDEVLQDMLQRLDPHSYYISAADLQATQEPLEGSFMGIGVEFAIRQDTIVVVSPVEGGPSAELGIRAGDRIVDADGKKLAGVGISNDEVMRTLRGPRGTKVSVGIVRGAAPPFQVAIERGEIPINSLAAALLDPDGTGYIRLSRFARTTHEEFVHAAQDLRARGMTRLVLDLRGNGGGYLNAAIAICEELLPQGRGIVYTEGRSSPRKDFSAGGRGMLVDMPLAVLIDEGSASASEIVAGAIQDNDRGTIVGRRSFGKGLVQEHLELPDHSAVRLTTARYYTPSGRSIQRPYGDSIAYEDDFEARYDHGELLHADSIHLDSSLVYTTHGGRKVYGGGGIMPDVFVPADTTDRSPYLSRLFFSGAINDFAFAEVDRQRATLSALGDPATFNARFHVSDAMLDRLAGTAVSLGVARDPNGLLRSRNLIAERVKAAMARNLWRDTGYYTVVLEGDPIYQRARMDLLRGGSLIP